MVGSSAMAGWIVGTGSGIVQQYSLGGKSSGVRDVADHAAVVEAVPRLPAPRLPTAALPRLRGRPRRQRPLFVELSAAGASGQGLRLSELHRRGCGELGRRRRRRRRGRRPGVRIAEAARVAGDAGRGGGC